MSRCDAGISVQFATQTNIIPHQRRRWTCFWGVELKYNLKWTGADKHHHTDLFQYHNESWGWWQLVVYNHVHGELSQDTDLHCRQKQAGAKRQSQLRWEAVVQRPPEQHGIVGNKQGVGKHDDPSPGDGAQLSKGVEQQVELQDQPDICINNVRVMRR